MINKHVRYAFTVAVLGAVYFITARAGLALNAVSGFATLIWAPTGIALAALIIKGYKYWPGITIAAFLVNLVTGAPPLVALGIALGNTLEPLIGAFVLKRYIRFEPSMKRVKDVLGLVLIAALGSTMISATVGVTSLILGGLVASSNFGVTWLSWWVGDMLGVLVAAPLLLVWYSNHRIVWRRARLTEAILLAILLVGASLFVFRGFSVIGIKPVTFAYIIFPFLIWTALRFGQRGGVTAIFTVSVITIWCTLTGRGPFSGNTLSQNLLILQSFMGVSAATFMTMAAVVAERERTQTRRQQLQQRTQLLTRQRTHLLALNQAKDEFISIASHQLRTPATGVKQFLGMLLENYSDGTITENQRKMLTQAYESNERQLHIIGDLLSVARLDAGSVKLKKDDVDLVPLIADILNEQASTFAARRHEVLFSHTKTNFRSYVDKVKLEMAIGNIIDNASKYTQPGKKIVVQLKKSGNDCLIAVKDEGIGIAKQDSKKLFKKFSRISSAQSTSVEGSGLGLYFAKKIIDLHRGSISVISKPNRGTTFMITLPMKKQTARARS